jgi:16S rRNA (cytosine1402-N4)-methyltransferase
VTATHVPVLAEQVVRLAVGSRRAVDATAGDGGHTARLRALGAVVLAIDRDPEAIRRARARHGTDGLQWHCGRFGDDLTLDAIRKFQPDLVLFDLGVSSHHLDDDARGFSFRPNVTLDMRMDRDGVTAAELLNQWPRPDLVTLFRDFADERKAPKLAAAIVRRRARQPLSTSDDLVNAIRSALGPRSGPSDFARLFQAVRMAVNDELEQLRQALPAVRDAVVPGGRLLVISYHSGEDRIVKHAFKEWARRCVCPPESPICTCRGHRLGRLDPPRPVVPTNDEVAMNPRARSAKLRGFLCGRDT